MGGGSRMLINGCDESVGVRNKCRGSKMKKIRIQSQCRVSESHRKTYSIYLDIFEWVNRLHNGS
jgi:hypothetical protein